MEKSKYLEEAKKYAQNVKSGKIKAEKRLIQACTRFLNDLKRKDLELHTKEPDFVIEVIERVMVHKQGEDMEGHPFTNRPVILQPWQVFIVYNLLGFYYKGTKIRRYKEALIMVPRKNGKTIFVACLTFGIALLERKSGAVIYIVAASLDQAAESFEDIIYSIDYRGLRDEFKIRDNNQEHSIRYESFDSNGVRNGGVKIKALASNPKKHDSFNSNIQIVDEMHAVSEEEYDRVKESGKSYRNKLCIGITTAGDNQNSFCYRRKEYADKVLNGTVEDDSLFCFITQAEEGEKGEVDFTNPIQHQMANPSYGVTISPAEMMNDAMQALNDPQQRKSFLSRSLNIYTQAQKAWFDIEEFRSSDRKYNWTIDQLAKLPISWYGGADLSRTYDLTATALYGIYKGVDIIITHGFFPRTQAAVKADQDKIPLYGWEEDGWLTICNSATVNMGDVVNWFKGMAKKGFKIKEVGHDRKFAGEEYIPAMRKAGFRIVDQPQYFYVKSQGFRHIEKAAKDGLLYYVHSEAYEYCVQNVHAIEKTDDAVQYDKIKPELRIDLFDASVFACIRAIEGQTQKRDSSAWWSKGDKN